MPGSVTREQVEALLAEVCGYHQANDCEHCADTIAFHVVHGGRTYAELYADIQLYRVDRPSWAARVAERAGT